MRSRVDIAIVGGGLVGLALAAALGSSRLSVAIIEGGSPPAEPDRRPPTKDGFALDSGFDPRVSAITAASRGFLERIGGWPDNRVCDFAKMQVWDGRGAGEIEFDAAALGEPALGSIVENRALLHALYLGVDGLVNTALHFDTQVTAIERNDEGFLVMAGDDLELACNLLVGADGGNSIVRRARELRVVQWEYAEKGLVSTIQTARRHDRVARQCFTSDGPLALLPLETPEMDLCSIVWSTATTDTLLGLEDDAMCKALTLASEGVLGDVLAIDQRRQFPLRQQHLMRYVEPHVALLGDAAHTIHPLAGQGANLGLADAQCLAALLNECRFSETRPGDVRLLRRYQVTRQPQNLLMGGLMEGIKRLYEPGHPALVWLRNAGTRAVSESETLKSLLARFASGRP